MPRRYKILEIEAIILDEAVSVSLEEYLKIAKAYHYAAHGNEEDFPNCEQGLCDEAHAVAMLAEARSLHLVRETTR